MARRNNSKNNGKKKERKPKPPPKPAIVGPSYIQVLKHADFIGKKVTLILCGESHEDAIDVTRKDGIFEAKEGWAEHTAPPSWVGYRIITANPKYLSLEQSQEWGKHRLANDDEFYSQTALLWVQEGPQQRKKSKGKSFLLEFAKEFEDMDEENDDDGNEEEDRGNWVPVVGSFECLASQLVPEGSTIKESPFERLFEWADLDAEAHNLSQRRLSAVEIDTEEIDSIIRKRKHELKLVNNIWTFDDWFSHVRSSTDSEKTDVQLILEAPVHPWEVRLHRPTSVENLPPAPDYIRGMSEDEESDEEDDHDPSADGVGSYIDFMYRKFIHEVLSESGSTKGWLGCIDVRDMGCIAAVTTDFIKQKWKNLLFPDELISIADPSPGRKLEVSQDGNYVKFLPSDTMNPEIIFRQDLISRGLVVVESSDDTNDECEEDNDFSFPSFEGFFGQASDCLYYSPHVKLSYSPFLVKCVRSLSNWEAFFSELFLGGTVDAALSLLDLESQKAAIHVRSPLMELRNPTTSLFEYKLRDDGDNFISYPYFPCTFYLVSKNHNSQAQEQTWSSSLFAKLVESPHDNDRKELAVAVRKYILEKIARQSDDPKCFDDIECGGEWFEAYLRAFHRHIYDDIDRSDASVLLRARRMRSESEEWKKYDVGSITIPSTTDGFGQIVERFALESELPANELITPQIECMAKILIDIWMSNLVDFAAMLKVVDVISEAKTESVAVVCYLGSAHTKALADFFVNRMRFRRDQFVGKVDWDEGEPRTLDLPSSLWDL